MSLRSLAPIAIAAAFCWSPAEARDDLYVVPGVDAVDVIYAPPPPARSHTGAPVANARPVTHADPHRNQPGRYGGGFLEMLVTGRDPTPARAGAVYNVPPPVLIAPAPAQALVAAPAPVRVAAYAPAPEPEIGVRRVVDPVYLRQEVAYSGPHGPGVIVVDTPNRFLYLVLPGRRAVRYGIGVGRPGFAWSGVKRVTRKAEWPSWTPPAEMLKRRPDLPRFMPGGPENPLGARALYLGSSLYRIHGTNEPWTIGQNVSSGCIRMMNEDVTDLYGRVRVGATVVVI
ncbi:MAG TPA: L,D-transpeptidase [Beijerinckiaceae bacterium]